MPPAAGGRGGGSGSSTDQSSSTTSTNIPLVAALLSFAVVLLVSFCICISVYRRSRLRKARIERRVQRERDWMRVDATGFRQDPGWEARGLKTPTQDEREEETAVRGGSRQLNLRSNPTGSSGSPVGDKVPAETGSFLTSPSLPPPVYTRMEKNGDVR